VLFAWRAELGQEFSSVRIQIDAAYPAKTSATGARHATPPPLRTGLLEPVTRAIAFRTYGCVPQSSGRRYVGDLWRIVATLLDGTPWSSIATRRRTMGHPHAARSPQRPASTSPSVAATPHAY